MHVPCRVVYGKEPRYAKYMMMVMLISPADGRLYYVVDHASDADEMIAVMTVTGRSQKG